MNRTRMNYIVLLLGALAGTVSAQSQPEKALLGRADSLMKLGRHSDAIAMLDKAVAREPKNALYLLARGRFHASTNQYEKAKADYFAALMLDPECARCLLDLGTLETINGNPRAALPLLNRALDMKNMLGAEELADAHYMRAQIEEALNERASALVDYNHAVRLAPSNPDYLIGRGMFHLLGENMEEALANFDAAVKLAPESSKPYFYRARYYVTNERWEKALEDLNRCIALGPGELDPLLVRGTTYLSMEKYAEALADYDKVLARDPANVNAYYNRAIARYRTEDMDGSCSDSRHLLKLLEANKSDEAMLIEVRRDLQRHCDSAYPGYFYHRGIAAYNNNDFQGAIASYNRGLKQFPNDPMLIYFRGNAYLAAGRYEDAIHDYGKVLEAREAFLASMAGSTRYDTTNATTLLRTTSLMSVYHGLFQAKYALKDYDGALGDLNRTLETAENVKMSGTEKIYFERGSILMLQGKQGEAVRDLDRTIQLNPDFAPAYLFKAIAMLNDDEPSRYQISSVDLDFDDSRSSVAHIEFPLEEGDDGDTSATTLEKVLNASNRAIELDPTLGYAYVVRGYASMLAKRRTYCDDFNKAMSMGVKEAAPLLETYCK